VQGSQFTFRGTSEFTNPRRGEAGGLSLVGGDITMQSGTLTVPGGNVALVSVGKPSNKKVGGEVTTAGTPTGFASMGKITVSQSSVINVTNPLFDSDASIGTVVIRGGQVLIDNATISAYNTKGSGTNSPTTTVTVDSRGSLTLQDSHVSLGTESGRPGSAELTAGTGITLMNSTISTASDRAGDATLTAPTISIRGGAIDVSASAGGGTIQLNATNSINLTDTILNAVSFFSHGGTILINGGKLVTANQTIMDSPGMETGGIIEVQANKIALTDSRLTTGGIFSNGGFIRLDAKTATLKNSQLLSNSHRGQGGTITIRSPSFHQDTSTLIDASSQFGINGTITINGVPQP